MKEERRESGKQFKSQSEKNTKNTQNPPEKTTTTTFQNADRRSVYDGKVNSELKSREEELLNKKKTKEIRRVVVKSDDDEDEAKIEAKNWKNLERKIIRKYDFDKNDNNIKCNISKEPAETEELVEPNKSKIGATEEKLQMIECSHNGKNGSNSEMGGVNHHQEQLAKELIIKMNNYHNKEAYGNQN